MDDRLFLAARNLAVALPYIRKRIQDRVLWIDAISINQDDLDERNSQVPLMRATFPGAGDVVI